ncbi:MAG TPA: FGLLP motif-containing membrane protein [Pseudolysinimonas sp.]|nr:FGLLP motif-containing membrane protein [Pseudolysinimonas sp.]
MGATRDRPRRRLRRILSGVLACLLAVGGAGGIVVFGPAESASAAPVDIFSPLEIDPITSASWPFVGTANPGESVTVQPLGGAGDPCTAVADALGDWSCNVTFTGSGSLIQVQAISFDHLTPDSEEDTKEYSVSIEPSITVTSPGTVASNVVNNPSFSGVADPGATIDGTINAVPCATVAGPTGAYTCTAPTILPGAGTYPITVNQTPIDPGFASDDATADYVVDLTAPGLSDIIDPYDTVTALPPQEVSTSNTTPTFVGLAEPYAHGYVVYALDADGVLPPTASPGLALCDAPADAVGEFSCSASLPVGDWSIGTWQQDEAGNTGLSPDGEFILHILPPPPAPTVHTPIPGYTSQNPRVHVSTTNLAEGSMYVREGGADLCPVTPVGVSSFACDTVPLSPGVHQINVLQVDQYGTFSPAAQRTVTILPPPVVAALKTLTFSFRILGPDGNEVDEAGLVPGDQITIVSEGLPVGTEISVEIHSTPQPLGRTTIGDGGSLALAATIPAEVEIGDHEIVVAATAPGYAPATLASPLTIREPAPPPEEPPGKEVGEPGLHHGTGTGGQATGNGLTDPSVFGSSLDSPFGDHSFALSVAGMVLSGSIAIAFILLVGFPAELLESTIRSNYDRAFSWLARLRAALGRVLAPVARLFSRPAVGTAATILLAAFLLGFADPGYGFNGQSVRLMLAMVMSVVAINIGLSLIVMRVARRAFDVAALLKPMPAALAIVGISVLVSRLAGISPGFLFGIVLGVVYARELKLRDDARLGLLGVGLTIAAGLLAWLGYGIASATVSGTGFFNNLLIEVLAAVTLEALGTLVIALLPIEFLDGRTIFRWSKLAWLGAYLVTALVFLFVVVPLSDNWGTMSAPVLGWGTLFAVFAVVAIATWAIFRRRSRVSSSSPAAAGPPRRRQR